MSFELSAKRYAQAIFDIAKERNEIEVWFKSLVFSLDILQQDSNRAYFESAKISSTQKVEALNVVLKDIHPLLFNLMGILVSRNLIHLLSQILWEYEILLDNNLNRCKAEVVTALPLEQNYVSRLEIQLSEIFNKDVVLTAKVNPEVIGGLMIRVGDRIIDGSTKGKLNSLRKLLSEVPA